MIFDFKLLGKVELPESAINFLEPYRQMGDSNETGGVIVGKKHNGLWVLSTPMAPSPRDQAGRTWHKRNREDAQNFINTEFDRTQGECNYLGEWHTHPEADPRPSSEDYSMLSDLLETSRLEVNFLVGLILGNKTKACLWIQTKTGQREVRSGIELFEGQH